MLPRPEHGHRNSATWAHMSRLVRSSTAPGDPPALHGAEQILKKSGEFSPSTAIPRLVKAICRLEAEGDEAAIMTPSREPSTLSSTQPPVPYPSSTTTASTTSVKASGTTAFESSRSRTFDWWPWKERKKRGKRNEEKHPTEKKREGRGKENKHR